MESTDGYVAVWVIDVERDKLGPRCLPYFSPTLLVRLLLVVIWRTCACVGRGRGCTVLCGFATPSLDPLVRSRKLRCARWSRCKQRLFPGLPAVCRSIHTVCVCCHRATEIFRNCSRAVFIPHSRLSVSMTQLPILVHTRLPMILQLSFAESACILVLAPWCESQPGCKAKHVTRMCH